MFIAWLTVIVSVIVVAICITLLVILLIPLRDKHHYDDQESDGSCDPMDDKIDKYDDN